MWRYVQPEYGWDAASDSSLCGSRQKITDSLSGSTPVEIFEELLTPEIFQHIRTETLRYALDDPLFSMDDSELKAFIGILVFSGYVTIPSEKLYWSESEDLAQDIVRKAMPRSKYMKIKQYLHVHCPGQQKAANQHGQRFQG